MLAAKGVMVKYDNKECYIKKNFHANINYYKVWTIFFN